MVRPCRFTRLKELTCARMARRSEVVVETDLEHGRRCFAEANWREAHAALAGTAREAADLELFAQTAYMLGRDDEYVSALERAHRAHLGAGTPTRAVRCAFWIGHSWLFRGQIAPAQGWFARARRLFEREERDVAERGYVLLTEMLARIADVALPSWGRRDRSAGCTAG